MANATPSVLRFDVYTRTCSDARCGAATITLSCGQKLSTSCATLSKIGSRRRKDELIKAVWPGVFVTDDAWFNALGMCGMRCATRLIRSSRPSHAAVTFFPRCVRNLASSATHFHQNIQFCRTQDGVKLAMASIGQGVPLVRPPTWFNHLEYDWHVQFRSALYRFLANRFQLIRYDGRGNGLSDTYVPNILLATMEYDLEAVVDALTLAAVRPPRHFSRSADSNCSRCSLSRTCVKAGLERRHGAWLLTSVAQ